MVLSLRCSVQAVTNYVLYSHTGVGGCKSILVQKFLRGILFLPPN